MKIVFAAFIGWFTLSMNHFPANKSNKPTCGNLILRAGAPLTKTHWKLVQLSNVPVPVNKAANEMYIVFKDDGTVSGNGGCNNFSGTYLVGKNNEISFGNMVRTNILCPEINFEEKYLNALAKADHYMIIEDTLSLQRQFISVAKFVAVN
ncbi:MAG: META domain-containing protein [Bacteroidota bacterium]|nr:META domain-containing protein [Bacteroidota bacterium]